MFVGLCSGRLNDSCSLSLASGRTNFACVYMFSIDIDRYIKYLSFFINSICLFLKYHWKFSNDREKHQRLEFCVDSSATTDLIISKFSNSAFTKNQTDFVTKFFCDTKFVPCDNDAFEDTLIICHQRYRLCCFRHDSFLSFTPCKVRALFHPLMVICSWSHKSDFHCSSFFYFI